MDILNRLLSMQDVSYRDFQAKLIPNIDPQTIIGVRTPQLRALAEELAKTEEGSHFLGQLPHRFFEENQLHAFLICEMKDCGEVLDALNRFLPYVDNWATCDQLRPRVLAKHKDKLRFALELWLGSSHTYTLRFGIGMLMVHFLDGDFHVSCPEQVSRIRSDEYYVNMMIAWYFATALAKQYEAVLPYLTEQRLAHWVHNKAIQKARESFRITPEQKAYLNTLRLPLRSV